MQQSDVFLQGEGDAYHRRNRLKYAAMVEKDPVLKVIEQAELKPSTVLEIGCATGWRLAEVRKRYGSICTGIEPSFEAWIEGKESFPGLFLHKGTALDHSHFDNASFDLIVSSFVLHWIDRSQLLLLLAQVDRMLKIGGHLVISDFWPMWPTKVPYKHVDKLYTYKANYPLILVGTGCYREVKTIAFNADTLEEGLTDAKSQGRCSLLEKGDFYQLCE